MSALVRFLLFPSIVVSPDERIERPQLLADLGEDAERDQPLLTLAGVRHQGASVPAPPPLGSAAAAGTAALPGAAAPAAPAAPATAGETAAAPARSGRGGSEGRAEP